MSRIDPQPRSCMRSVSASARGLRPDEVRSGRPFVLSYRAPSPVRSGWINCERWLNDGGPNPLVRIELFRLVLIGESPIT